MTQQPKITAKKLDLFMKDLGIQGCLKLTLERKPFDLMECGIKDREFRKPSKWILSRLLYSTGKEKQYDLVKFSNGYAPDAPFFICEYKGFYYAKSDHIVNYEGFKVEVSKGDIIIKLGAVLKRGNI